MRIRTVLALTLAVGACFGDPPPDAEDLPLEIVLHPDECVINYPQVGPGIHEVTVIFEGTSGSGRIFGAGETVFLSDAGSSGRADLVVGDYQVECQTDGVTRQVGLPVRQGATRRRLIDAPRGAVQPPDRVFSESARRW